jgi:hypothetical protein
MEKTSSIVKDQEPKKESFVIGSDNFRIPICSTGHKYKMRRFGVIKSPKVMK